MPAVIDFVQLPDYKALNLNTELLTIDYSNNIFYFALLYLVTEY